MGLILVIIAYGVGGTGLPWYYYTLKSSMKVQCFAPLAARLLRRGPETGIASLLDIKTLINFPLYVTAQEMRNITCLF